MNTFIIVTMILLTVLIILILALLIILLLRKPQDISPFINPIQNLTQAIGTVQSDLNGLSEKISSRQTSDQQTAESIKRLENIIAGTHTKGAAGENVIELFFSLLPADWQVRNFQVGHKVVEFGVRLRNNLVLPIDSKWPATNLLEQFLSSSDLSDKQRLKNDIEKAVLQKVKEVKKYIKSEVTTNFAIAAVPDAIYDLTSAVQVEALKSDIVLIAYSMFFPYILLIYKTITEPSADIDFQKLNNYLEDAKKNLTTIQEELEGRFSNALTMLNNSNTTMRTHLRIISDSLLSFQSVASRVNVTPQETTDQISAQSVGEQKIQT
jgi:DNA recombination protein RmuC